jgi:hypothetical protein
MKTIPPKGTPEFIVLEMGFSNISSLNLTDNKQIKKDNETKKPTININQIVTDLTNEFSDYLIEESRDYNLPLPVGITETSQATKLTNLVKKNISSTISNISETISALNSPSSTTSEKSNKGNN